MDLILTNEEELARRVKVAAVLAAVSIIWWDSASCEEGIRQIAGS